MSTNNPSTPLPIPPHRGGSKRVGWFLVLLLLPLVAFAAPIVPCGIDDAVARGLDASYAAPCGFNHFLIGINNVINFLIMIGGSIAAIVFAWAGILILTAGANESQMKKGREMFMPVVWGFVWMLSAWLLVKMVLTGLGLQTGFSLLQ